MDAEVRSVPTLQAERSGPADTPRRGDVEFVDARLQDKRPWQGGVADFTSVHQHAGLCGRRQ